MIGVSTHLSLLLSRPALCLFMSLRRWQASFSSNGHGQPEAGEAGHFNSLPSDSLMPEMQRNTHGRVDWPTMMRSANYRIPRICCSAASLSALPSRICTPYVYRILSDRSNMRDHTPDAWKGKSGPPAL